ncbi:MAG: GGDEF domain-containing protein [Alphaproteobacteria bacterium]|nr:GGDEF domain-containing protein [Alphaproteobacteria bacterium]
MLASTNHASAPAQPTNEELYERQFAKGFSSLRFDPPLEAEYRQALATEQRPAALLSGGVTLVIWAAFVVFDFVRLDVFNKGVEGADLWFLISGRGVTLIAIAILMAAQLRFRMPLGITALSVYCLVASVAAINAIIYKSHGIPAAEPALVVVVMAAFLPLGLVFSRALLASLVPVVAAAIAGVVLLNDTSRTGQFGLVFVLAMAVPVGSIGGYMRELAHRRQFLLTGMYARQAQFDPLTDLANRRLFHRHANAAISHAARNDEPVVLAMIDIDHFKLFNDNFGHAAGDDALCVVADAIRNAARRPMDMATRLGGEEFALLLYGSDMDRARPVLEALRDRIAATTPPKPGAKGVNISIGATMPGPGESLMEVYQRADRLLYASKTAGRDRITEG